ncbi:unnamed protein product [Calypogeia fissa]
MSMAPSVGANTFEVSSLFSWKLAFLLLLSLFQVHPGFGLSSDGQVLLQFKSSVDATQGALQTWNSADQFPCNWTGVKCDPTSQQVTEVDLNNQNLSGPVPGMLCQLPMLIKLLLGFNYLGGSIPSSLMECSSLEVLDLSYNYIVSPLPENIYQLQSLRVLDLSFNNFSGAIPSSIGDLPALQSLNLSANLLEGPLPHELGNLSNLVELVLDSNTFNYSLPSELGNLNHLEVLTITFCQVTGQIPPSLGNLNLTKLFLAGNALQGPIPSELGNLKRLQSLDLSQNSLTGQIPDELMYFPELQDFILWENNLTGPIPSSAGNLTSLVLFDVSLNQLDGVIPEGLSVIPSLILFQAFINGLTGSVPPGFGTLPNLYCLKLFSNQLTGQIPQNLGQSSVLQNLDLSSNQLDGPIPPGLCAGGNLTYLILFENQLTGPIPTGLGSCPTLQKVRLENNQLTSSLPDGLWGSPSLVYLALTNNLLSGSIGLSIGSAVALEALHLEGNQFSGFLPPEIGNIPNLTEFWASSNDLQGNLPTELGQLQWLSTLDLGLNSFSGSIPVEISQCLRLDKLNLSNNHFGGEIPFQLGNLPSLNTLDLSYNELSGPLPPQLGKLQLTEYNFSYNNLTGPLPAPFNLSLLPSSFVGNPGLHLCDNDGSLCSVPESSVNRSSSNHASIAWAIGASFAAVAVILFVGACCLWRRYYVSLYYWKNWRNHKDLTWSLRSFQKVTFIQEEVMEKLDENCLIGSGGSGKVYKVDLSNGQSVAVKKLEARYDNGFVAEVETLGKIRHRNIVKLLCCCWNYESNILVYEFMPNGSLGDYIHNTKCASVLGWDTRYKIAIGAAEGLAYLHHDCVPPIVHRDVKSNNILLDFDFEAHLGDFGLAKPFVEKSMSAVAGSYGYIAPEYGYTLKVSEKADIYSFGVVLLELVTGKKPIEPEFGDQDIVKWVSKRIETKAGAVGILDPKIRASAQESMMLVLKVGLLCTSFLPSNRPSMRDVVPMLAEASPSRQRSSRSLKSQASECKISGFRRTIKCFIILPVIRSSSLRTEASIL